MSSTGNRVISQIPECICAMSHNATFCNRFLLQYICRNAYVQYMEIDPSHKSQNASVPYPTMQHFGTEMCTHVHISVTKWCIAGHLSGELWDFVGWVYWWVTIFPLHYRHRLKFNQSALWRVQVFYWLSGCQLRLKNPCCFVEVIDLGSESLAHRLLCQARGATLL